MQNWFRDEWTNLLLPMRIRWCDQPLRSRYWTTATYSVLQIWENIVSEGLLNLNPVHLCSKWSKSFHLQRADPKHDAIRFTAVAGGGRLPLHRPKAKLQSNRSCLFFPTKTTTKSIKGFCRIMHVFFSFGLWAVTQTSEFLLPFRLVFGKLIL